MVKIGKCRSNTIAGGRGSTPQNNGLVMAKGSSGCLPIATIKKLEI